MHLKGIKYKWIICSVKPIVSLATEDNKEPLKFTPVDKKNGTYDIEFTPEDVKPIIAQVSGGKYSRKV